MSNTLTIYYTDYLHLMGQILIFKLRKYLTFSAFISWLLSLQKGNFCGNKIANCKPALLHRSFEYMYFLVQMP